MSGDKVTLYDLPSKDKGNACWSLNPWKTRLALNFKGIPYETQWVEYPSVAPLLESFNIPPQEDEIAPYTIPAVRFPDGTYLMNSKPIAAEIERRYPAPDFPALHLYDPVVERSYALTREAATPLSSMMLPSTPKNLLNPVSAEYFERTRKEMFGMSLEELGEKFGGEPAWEKAKKPLARAGEALREKEGPFFLGETPSYADFIYVGFIYFLRRAIGEEGFQRVCQMQPEIKAQYEASEKWLERDSY